MWKKMSQEEISSRVFYALDQNINFKTESILGIPASYLDKKVFYHDAVFLKDAPFMSTMVQNPNHIGCHTLGDSEPFFKGTHAIEREVIEICAVDILKAEAQSYDGYIASGGTEANLQAVWIYRNYFIQNFKANHDEICIVSTVDSHYSVDKAANIFLIDVIKIQVDENLRTIDITDLTYKIQEAKSSGKKYFIVICNMMTTMFGSVDDIDVYINTLTTIDCEYKIHVDGAYGGFYYPFLALDDKLTFKNECISSFTLDAHKMAQAPYGTGIFVTRKGMMKYCQTSTASYVKGEDCTLIGSRSGANAIAVWMILMKYGHYGWIEKLNVLHRRTDWLCDQLTQMGIHFYRNQFSNIVALSAEFISPSIAIDFGLVPDDHHHPYWYKIVVMEHVDIEKLMPFIIQLNKNILSVEI